MFEISCYLLTRVSSYHQSVNFGQGNIYDHIRTHIQQ